jgi:hypothetical protein
MPLQDVRIDIDLVACQLVRRLAAVRKAQRGAESLWSQWVDANLSRNGLVRQRPVALHADADRRGESGDCDRHQPSQQPQQESERAYPEQRSQARDEQQHAEQAEAGGGEQPWGGKDVVNHAVCSWRRQYGLSHGRGNRQFSVSPCGRASRSARQSFAGSSSSPCRRRGFQPRWAMAVCRQLPRFRYLRTARRRRHRYQYGNARAIAGTAGVDAGKNSVAFGS